MHPKQNWEWVEQEGGIPNTNLYRSRVPGGWLYMISYASDKWDSGLQVTETTPKIISLTFVPEAEK